MAPTESRAPGRNSALRVLVVDDHVDGADALCAVLQTLGCVTAVAYNGEHGLAIATLFSPDLAFIDLEMPDMSGCDVALALRATPRRSATRLICLTGHGQPQDMRLCIAAGFDGFFTKPILPHTLADVVSAEQAGKAHAYARSQSAPRPVAPGAPA